MLQPVGDLDISKVVSTTNDTEMANVATSEIQHNHSDLPSPSGRVWLMLNLRSPPLFLIRLSMSKIGADSNKFRNSISDLVVLHSNDILMVCETRVQF